MVSHRKTAVITGVLFIIATAFLFIGESVYQPVLNSPDYLNTAHQNSTQAVIGILLEFACVLAIPLIPVFLYPVVKRHNEALALGYISFRLFEAVLFLYVEINKLSLISLSRQYVQSGNGDMTLYQTIGAAIQALNEWAFSMYVLVFCVGAMLLYTVLLTSKLIPRFIAAWGLGSAVLLLTGAAVDLAGLLPVLPEGVLELIIATPIAVQEMVMAVWLIVKGFNPTAVVSEAV